MLNQLGTVSGIPRESISEDFALITGFANAPDFKIDGRDFPDFHPVLTTDCFEFGTSRNGLEREGSGVEMGDPVRGMVAQEINVAGGTPPKWLGSGLIDPEDDGSGERDGGHECVGATVVAGVDAAPVLKASEHVFDLVATTIEGRVVRDRHLAVLA